MRVVIAEDQALLRDGLIRILEGNGFDVVHAVADAPALDVALDEPDIDIAVLDVRLPPGHATEGLVAATRVRVARPAFPVLVLSAHIEPGYARDLLASGEGAIGYLLKDRVVDVASFVDAVRHVASGGTVLDPEVVSALLARADRRTPVSRLTPREREVLGLMAEGRSNGAIAAAMVITEKAVGKHSSSIFTKLDLPIAPDDNRRVLAVLAWLHEAN